MRIFKSKISIITGILIFALSTVAYAQTALNADSISFSDGQLHKIKFWPDNLGQSMEDTMPNDEFAKMRCLRIANGMDDSDPFKQDEIDKCETTNFGLKPDGYVLKPDSPYYDQTVEDGGQKELFTDKLDENFNPSVKKIQEYPGYDPAQNDGIPWDQLSIESRFFAHLTKAVELQSIGKDFEIVFDTEVGGPEYGLFVKEVLSDEGFEAPLVVLFTEDRIEVNSKYIYGGPQSGTSITGVDNRRISLRLFVPNEDIEVYEAFIEDLEEWDGSPRLTRGQEDGLVVYIQ